MLKGQAKTDYQREYMRNYQRVKRGSKQSGLNKTDTGSKLKAMGLTMQGNTILTVKKALPSEVIPLYNPSIHRAGDIVMMQSPYSRKLVKVTIPTLDGDGNPITEY